MTISFSDQTSKIPTVLIFQNFPALQSGWFHEMYSAEGQRECPKPSFCSSIIIVHLLVSLPTIHRQPPASVRVGSKSSHKLSAIRGKLQSIIDRSHGGACSSFFFSSTFVSTLSIYILFLTFQFSSFGTCRWRHASITAIFKPFASW